MKKSILKDFLNQYSFDDLVKSFFAINLWLPNIGSPIKLQYLYLHLEAYHNKCHIQNKIINYNDFYTFYTKLIDLTPSFPEFEDYVPETDWADISYYFDSKFYKIFYGGDIMNPYDYYYSFEVIHKPFEMDYFELINRSPMNEMKFCLELQNDILTKLKHEIKAVQSINSLGYIEAPTEKFWLDSINLLNQYSTNSFDSNLVHLYTKELSSQSRFPSMQTFLKNTFLGQNCDYFFLKKDSKLYPVMPRNWLNVIYNKWGTLLETNYEEIQNRQFNKNDLNIYISIALGQHIKKIVDDGSIFDFSTLLNLDSKPVNNLIYTTIYTNNKLYFIYVTPPFRKSSSLQRHLKEITPLLKESAELVKQSKMRLHLYNTKQDLVFLDESKSRIEPIFLIVIPNIYINSFYKLKLPQDIESEIINLDQLCGIFDEINNSDEFNDFFDYIRDEERTRQILILNTFLDKYAAFKQSQGVIVKGAIEPNLIMLDFGTGSNYRFESLKEFWKLYPIEFKGGYPRSWAITSYDSYKNGLILKSKVQLSYFYFHRLGNSSIFITTLINRIRLENREIADNFIHSLFDAIDLCYKTLSQLEIASKNLMIQLVFCPSEVVKTQDDLNYFNHLIPDKENWLMDVQKISAKSIGIRVVYNHDLIVENSLQAKDKSFQLSLLIDILRNLNHLVAEPKLNHIVEQIESLKEEKPRFGMFELEKRVSYPQHVQKIVPDLREFKLADKDIAIIAHNVAIEPGSYSSELAKDKLNFLRDQVLELLNTKIKLFNFEKSIPILLEKSNALLNDAWQNEERLRVISGNDIDYDESELFSENAKETVRWYRVYVYLIEKFVQLNPKGSHSLSDENLKIIIALADRLLDLYTSSDFINYQIYPVKVEINSEYIVTIKVDTSNISTLEKEYGIEQAKISLGIIGNIDDSVNISFSENDYFKELDEAFKKDLGFRFGNFLLVQKLLSLWAFYSHSPESTYYKADFKQIHELCLKEIIDYDGLETTAILNFLLLKQEELLTIKDTTENAKDIPVWEHNKRLMRFNIRPLIKIENHYFWAPFSIERTINIWKNIANKHKLPSDFNTSTLKEILSKGHVNLEDNLVSRIKEIVLRHTSYVESDVFPHKFDKSIKDIGDFDIIAFIEKENIILNIEAKVIDAPHSAKDSGRVQRKIFGEFRSNGEYKNGYIHKVIEREKYLKLKGLQVLKQLNWLSKNSTEPQIISLFVTQIGFWWTKFPPTFTTINFVEIRLLDDFLTQLIYNE